MKKILVLAYDFPPYNSIASQRPASWLKYLPNYEIDITVVTRHWDNITSAVDYIKPSNENITKQQIVNSQSRIIRAPYSPNLRDKIIIKYGLNNLVWLRKVLSFFYSNLKFLSLKFDETNLLFDAANDYLKQHKVDCIIATGEPFILFKHAANLSNNHQTPWIADYRDCWTNPPKQNDKWFNNFYLTFLKYIEKKTLANASCITTASPTYKDRLQSLHPNHRIEVVLNGYDIDNIYTLQEVEINYEQFEIAYAGIIYPHQQVEMFLQGLAKFIKSKSVTNIKVVFYGLDFYPDMKDRITKFDTTLQPYIFFTERLPYNDVLIKLKQAHCLLLLTDENANWLNAKVFDYLAIKKPILLVKNDKGILESIVDENNVGFKASTAEDVFNKINSIYESYFLEKKEINILASTQKYSRIIQSKILAALIEEVIKAN